MRTFTTGEIASLCNVSVRTVQYYDQEGIISPSDLSEGGRRIYTETDLSKFQLTCLYKSLGFSLKEIKLILNSSDEYKIILDLIKLQQEKVEHEISDLAALKERLSIIHQELSEHKIMPVSSEFELNNLLSKKKIHRKKDWNTYLYLIGYCLLLIVGIPISALLGGITPYIMLGICAIALIGLIFYHSANNAYLCPYCHHKFNISFFQDLASLNGGKRGKYLKCPSCHKKNWMSETYRDDMREMK